MQNSDVPEITWTHRFLFDILEQIPLKIGSLVDVGCGRGVIGALVRIYRNPKRLVGVDAFQSYIDFCRRHNFYDELYQFNLMNTPLPFADKEFDVATCIEVIEHLPKTNGLAILNELERIATKVVITTPNVFFSQKTFDNNPFQRHLSIWSVDDFKERGYKVRGVGDLTFSGRKIKYASFFLSKFSYVIPKFAEALFAYKICK